MLSIYTHTTGLKRLHWLPVKQRATFKLLFIKYKAVHGLAPQYICELVQMKQSSREIQSKNQYLLQIPNSRLQTYGDFAFSVARLTKWNRLPKHIRLAPTIEHFKSK